MKRPIIAFKDREKFKKLLIDFRLSFKSNVGKDLRIVVKGDKKQISALCRIYGNYERDKEYKVLFCNRSSNGRKR